MSNFSCHSYFAAMLTLSLATGPLCATTWDSTTGQSQVTLSESVSYLLNNCTEPLAATAEKQLRVVASQIAGAPGSEISAVLPQIIAPLSNKNVPLCSGILLFDISLRQDSAQLLGPFLDRVSALLDASDERLQGGAVITIGSLRPVPPDKAVLILTQFVQRPDADLKAQASAVFYLAKFGSQRAPVVAAVDAFVARPLPKAVRVGVLNALGDSHVSGSPLVQTVIDGLSDPDKDVKLASIHSLERIGRDALIEANPVLQELSESESQPVDVREAAQSAIAVITATSPLRH